MSEPTKRELDEYRADAEAWFSENVPSETGFMLPLTFMEVGTDQQFDFLRDWQKKVYQAGYLGAAWPKEYGGGGLPQEFQDIATSEMIAHNSPIMINAIGLNWTGPLLLDMGTEEDRHKYIKGILSAEDIWCQGFSEPDNGSDLGNVQTRAVRNGNDYIINGSKIWTTLGNYAKYMILLARTDPDTDIKHRGLSFFLSPMNVSGIQTTPIKKLTGEHGFTQTFFTDTRIPANCLMGKENQGWQIAMRTLEYERNARSGQAGGFVMKEFDPLEILELAKTANRNGQAAIEDPLIRDQLVEFIIEARSIVLNRSRSSIPALTQDNPMALQLISKVIHTEFIRELSQFALTLQGTKAAYYVNEPNGHEDGLWQRSYLNSFSATIGGGTSQIQRNIIGEHILGLPKSH